MNSEENPWTKGGNPTEMALLKYFHKLRFEVVQYWEYFDDNLHLTNPFNSDRKRMSKVIDVEDKTYIFMKGASEYMLETCDKIIDLKNNTVMDF